MGVVLFVFLVCVSSDRRSSHILSLELLLVGDHLDHPFVECAPPLGVRDLAVAVGVEALDVRVDELLPRRLLLQRKGGWDGGNGGGG